MQNWKKHISWNKQNNNFTHDHTLLYIFLPSLHDSNMKIPDVTFCGEHKHKEKTSFSFFWSLIQSFRIQPPTEEFVNNFELTKWIRTRWNKRDKV